MRTFTFLLLGFFVSTVSTMSQPLSNDFYRENWKLTEKFLENGQYRSAYDLAKTITERAKSDQNTSEFIKGLMFRTRFVQSLEEKTFNDAMNEVRGEIASGLPNIKPVLHSIYAEMIWNHYQQNRWRYMNRTTTEGFQETDIETWDLRKILTEAKTHFRASVANPNALQQLPIGVFNAVVHRQGNPDVRPTLYDFIAHRALAFFTNTEAGLSDPKERFAIRDKKWFATAQEFIQLPPLPDDALGADALRLWQDLTRFHLKDTDPSALIDLEVNRLVFVHRHIFTADKDQLFENALTYITRTHKPEAIAEAYYELAQLYKNQGHTYKTKDPSQIHKWKNKEALSTCEMVMRQFPNTRAALACASLKAEITTQSIEISVPEFTEPNQHFPASISFKNTKIAFLKAVLVPADQWMLLKTDYEAYNRFATKARKQKGAIFASQKLPDDGDLQTHITEVAFPKLPAGLYMLLVSAREDFSDATAREATTLISVSDIALVKRNIENNSLLRFSHRSTGSPLVGVEIARFRMSRNGKSGTLIGTQKSDQNGQATIPQEKSNYENRYYYRYAYNGQILFEGMDYRYYGYYPNYQFSDQVRTHLFTDRSIYRPGQKVYFKAIHLSSTKENDWNVVADQKLTVLLFNANNEKVAEIEQTTNEFGTISGEFTLPTGGLTGQFRLQTEHGRAYILVEEYKRPRFEVSFKPIEGTPALEEEVAVTVAAKSFSGANLSDATVSYRITRGAELPPWSWWRYWWNPTPPIEIAQGEGKTDANGNFVIRFKAQADPSQDPKTEPIFVFSIEANITDITGENHRDETEVRIGYNSLTLNADIQEIQSVSDLNKLTIKAQNLNGQAIPTAGQVTITRLKSPDRVLRSRTSGRVPDVQAMNEAEFKRLLPLDPFGDEGEMRNWKEGEKITSLPFDTGKNASIELTSLRLQPGAYLITLTAKDPQNRPVETRQIVTLYNEAAQTPPLPQSFWHRPLKTNVQPGENASFLIGAAGKTHVLFEIEHKSKIIYSEVIALLGNQVVKTIPIKEEHRGNLGYHLSAIRDNRSYTESQNIEVLFSNKDLKVAFETFRNKLYPGQAEEWRLKIAGAKGEAVAAEMVAAMYDASLDEFRGHGWWMSLWNYSSPQLGWGSTLMGTTSFAWSRATPAMYAPDRAYDLFGFDDDHEKLGDWPNFQNAVSGAANAGTISGTVYDSSNKKTLANALVLLENTSFRTRTDSKGQFSFNQLAAGSYVVLVAHPQHKTALTPITLHAEKGIKLTYKLDSTNNDMEVYDNVGGRDRTRILYMKSAPVPVSASAAGAPMADMVAAEAAQEEGPPPPPAPGGQTNKPQEGTTKPKNDLGDVKARTNLNETAFFLPQLRTNEKGEIVLAFTMPEALTRWNLLGLAHTKDLRIGQIRETVITQKDLMVTPNAPRFFRENDTITFTAKVDNLSAQDLNGQAQLFLFDALTNQPLDNKFGNTKPQLDFSVQKNGNALLTWSLKVPEGISAITYRVVAKAGTFTDGEEAALPVLTNRMLVTESLPLPIRNAGDTRFTFDKLLNHTSPTLRHQSLTVEFTPNPVWYAVQAIPYMMEYPYECAEQTFTRFYANAIASHLVTKQPKIQEIFRQWQTTDKEAFLSNLEKNQELKSVLLEETPWVFQSNDEQERKKRLGLLFDTARMARELEGSMQKLREMQLSNGAWPWFKGMEPSQWVTQHIVSGFARLKQLGVYDAMSTEAKDMVTRAVQYLDEQNRKDYDWIVKNGNLNNDNLSYFQIYHLYARGNFRNIEMNSKQKEAFDYFFGQAKKYWLAKSIYMQGMLAIGLNNYGETEIPNKIVVSLRERSINNKEMGMYWKGESGYWWYQAPIETHALMIEVFHRVANDQKAVEDLKLWLLKQKQTQDWKTTTATANAVYALLLRGTDLLAQQQTAKITLGNKVLDPQTDASIRSQAGTGYFKTTIPASEIKPEMGRITVNKTGTGAAWGAVYWQYFEQLDKITPAATPLKLERVLSLEKNTPNGPVLAPITATTPLKAGDRIKVRLVLRVDRAMEYVHLKDMRASGFEPENVLSGYRYQGGLGYYESTRDAATNFFIGWMNPGTYVFEYALRVTHAGDFSTGITSIQCMYAPEFASHSEGVRVQVRN